MSKRRPNGDGMVRKRPDGRWEARIIVGHKEDGKPIYKSVFGKTQSEAMTKFYKLLETYRGVELNEDCLVNLNEWLDRWLCYQKDVVRSQTLNKYIFYADAYVRPYLGDKKISAILTQDMQQLYVKLLKEGRVTESKTKGKSLSGSTVRAVHMMMHKCFEMAVEQHIIVKNPTDGTTIPALNSTERKVYNEEQLKKFLKIIENEPWWRNFFYLECMTGLRKGEICGLRWEDLNEAEGKLSVARQVIPVRGGITVSDPKTDTGIRTIVLPESVVRMLKERKKAIGSEWIFPSLRDAEKPINPNTAYGIISTPKTKSSVRSVHLPQSVLNILGEYRKTVNSEWVFPSPLDPTHPRSPTSCRSRLSDMLERAECNHIPFHGLRHIFSTMALENGLDIKTLSAVLGHSSAETTISVYSHVTGEMERNAAKKMDDAFGTPKPADSPVCDDNHDDGQTPEQEPKHAEFTAKKSKKRKPGTGCISKISKNTWQGKYTPRGKGGKREQHIVYAKSAEECERKLGEMIEKLKSNKITIA